MRSCALPTPVPTPVAAPADFADTPAWLEARRELLEQCLAQGYSLALPLEQAARTPKHRPLTLNCSRHGEFSLLPRALKESMDEGVCAGCRLERLTGMAMPSNAVIAAIKSTPMTSTAVRAAKESNRPTTLGEVGTPRAHRSTAAPSAPKRGLPAFQARLDARFGTGVLSLGAAPFEGERASRQVLCLKDTSHGTWVTSPRSLQRLKGDEPCPRCRQERFEKDASVPCQMRKPGGYLYRIVDAASPLRYLGLTTVTPEQRFQGHRDAAARGVAHPLYAAMRSRPADFTVQPLAYFWDICDLQAAEKEAIAEEGTRWPAGYNLTEGGEYGSRETPRKRLQRVLDKVYTDEPVKEDVLEAAYKLYLNGTRLEHLYELIRKRTTPAALLSKLDGTGMSSNKMTSIEVRGELYTEGLVATCKAFRLCTKSVRRITQMQGLTTGQAIEQLLDKRERVPEAVVVIDGVGYTSLVEAQRTLKVSYQKAKRMAQTGSSELGTAACPVRLSTADQAKQLGVPREFYRNARKKGLLDEDILRLGQNLRVLAGTADHSHLVVEGVTYASMEALRETLGLSRSLARALAYSTLTVAQAQEQMRRLTTPSDKPGRTGAHSSKDALNLPDSGPREPAQHLPVLAQAFSTTSAFTTPDIPLDPSLRVKLPRGKPGSRAQSDKTWLGFTIEAQAFFEQHGHLRISVKDGATDSLVGRSERIRARFKLGQLCEEQVQWLAQRGYRFDALGERQAHREQMLELARRHYDPTKAGAPLTEAEAAQLERQVKNWLRGLMGGELSPVVREALAALNVDWRFSELVFEQGVFLRWAQEVAKAHVLPGPMNERYRVWLSFAHQALRRGTMPAECAVVMQMHPELLPSAPSGFAHLPAIV